jgi:hypothetical protein
MKYYVIFIAGLIIGFLLSFFANNIFSDGEINNVILRDTIIKTIPSEPIILEKVKMKIVYRADTIIQTAPFTASIDTIIVKDTLNAVYKFPENLFSLSLRMPQDTIKTIYQVSVPVVKCVWYDKLLYFGAGALSGGLIVTIIK